jgi:hypothetical protein
VARCAALCAELARFRCPPRLPIPNTADWRQRAILQFRLMRKRALRQTIERVAEALGTDGGAGADGGGAPVEAAAAAAAETDEHELDDEQAAEGAQDEL